MYYNLMICQVWESPFVRSSASAFLACFSFHSGIHSVLFYPQVNYKRFHCVNLKQYGDVYIRHECADDWAYPNIKASAARCQSEIETVVLNTLDQLHYTSHFIFFDTCQTDDLVDLSQGRLRTASGSFRLRPVRVNPRDQHGQRHHLPQLLLRRLQRRLRRRLEVLAAEA